MQKIAVNGTELEYQEEGRGEPLLLVSNGPFPDSFVHFFNQPALHDHYRLICYRQRRWGEGVEAAVSFEQHAADAVDLLDGLGIDRAHVAGHSTGACIALQLASTRPRLVHSLILMELVIMAVPAAPLFVEKIGPALAAYERGEREEAMRLFVTNATGLDWQSVQAAVDQCAPGALDLALRNGRNLFESYLPALGQWRFGSDEAASIAQPILSVTGSETGPLFRQSNEALRSWFPHVEERRIEGLSHLLHLQDPDPVVPAIDAFLAHHAMTAAVGR
ncbi:MAG TPA: alpha/beta hydrolase [Dehalococcoidia bacterium]|nr:alpha/beta hydrolase [Dehalococcoidia bacterium]